MDSNSSERRRMNRRAAVREPHKEQRLSKESIGQPIKIEKNGKFSTFFNSMSNIASTQNIIMKSITVTPDDRGFGLSLSGNNPVFVESVKKGGAAEASGIMEGDKIIKVNGDSVKHMSHAEVVKLIKGGSKVVFSLSRTPSSSVENISGSIGKSDSVESIATQSATQQQYAIYDEKIQTFKKMLKEENKEMEKIKEEYAKNPEAGLLKDLSNAQKMKQDLEKQLWKAESMKQKMEQDLILNLESTQSPKSLVHNSKSEDSKERMNLSSTPDQSAHDRPSQNTVAARLKEVPIDTGDIDNHTHPATDMVVSKEGHTVANEMYPDQRRFSADVGFAAVLQPNNTVQVKSTSIMGFEDVEDDIPDTDSDHGPFSDFETLRHRPAHLAVFFNYVLERDPSSFLLTNAVDTYKQLTSAKEMVKLGDTIHRTYLASNAVFKAPVNEGIASSISMALHGKTATEESLRGVFDPAVQLALKEVRTQLGTYRVTREQGIGGWFGDEKLRQAINAEQQSDSKLVEDILNPTIAKLQQVSSCDEADQIQTNIKLEALQAFINMYGMKRGKKASRIYSKLRSSKSSTMSKANRISGSMDSIIDDTKDKRMSAIGGIFGGKKLEKSKSKSDKQRLHNERSFGGSRRRNKASRRHTIRDNPPPAFGTGLAAQHAKLGAVSSLEIDSLAPSSDGSFDAASGHAAELAAGLKGQRPVSAHCGDSTKMAEALAAPTHSAYLHSDSVSNIQFTPSHHRNESADWQSTGKSSGSKTAISRTGSFGSTRNVSGKASSHKSHSDPDRDKVEEAVNQHNTWSNDQSESLIGQNALMSADSVQSLFDDGKVIDRLPSLNQDDEIDIDAADRQWSDDVPKSVLRDLDKKEIKRQQVINELICTEQHHVRDLKILEKLFYEPMQQYSFLSKSELHQAFPNLRDILQLHREFNRSLQEKKEMDQYVVTNIGDILLARFDGDAGNEFKNECATYCGNQSTVLSLIKEKSKKNPSFSQFLEAASRVPACRRLSLKDFVPMQFQRLTKYPMLLENIIKYTKKKREDEIKKLKIARERCRDILSFVNQAVKEAEDREIIAEIERTLDREPILKMKNPSQVIMKYKNIELALRPSIQQGPLQWRIAQGDKRKLIPIHCILYNDLMVLLQKQDDRHSLRPQETHAIGGNITYDPFILMTGVHVRNVAVDKRAFFVVSWQAETKSAQMYEFVCSTSAQMKQWVNIISKTATHEVTTPALNARRKGLLIAGSSRAAEESIDEGKFDKEVLAGEIVGRSEENLLEPLPEDYTEISSSVEPVMSLQNRVNGKHQEIDDSLEAKYELLAKIADLPVSQLENTLEMCVMDENPEPSTLVRHAVVCADKLTSLINASADPDHIFAKSRKESKRLSSADQVFQNDGATPTDDSGRPATSGHTSSQKLLSPLDGSTGTLNSISDLPLSGTEPAAPPSWDGSNSKSPQYSVSIENEKPDASASSLDQLATSSSYEGNFEQTSSEKWSSRPSSSVDLCVSASDVPVDEMLQVALLLQQQLTRLMRVTDESERQREELLAENDRLKKLEANETASDVHNTTEEDAPPPYAE